MTALVLIGGAIIDAIFGEPRAIWDRIPHPAVLMGRCVTRVDNWLNHGTQQKLKGVIGMVMLVLAALVLGFILQAVPYMVVDIIVVAILLAQKSLVDHVRDVATALGLSTVAGRTSVALIVGRDTDHMDDAQIARSAIESGAENFSDGVIAPAFWFLLGGLPGLLMYKITNTADSMIGYKTEKHLKFGWAAARLDDLLNWVPARLSALLIMISAPQTLSFKAIRQDAKLHRSPNAGWPEAAMSRAIGVALSGPRSYEGKMQEFPFVNAGGARSINATEINAAVAVLWRAWAIGLGLTAISVFVL